MTEQTLGLRKQSKISKFCFLKSQETKMLKSLVTATLNMIKDSSERSQRNHHRGILFFPNPENQGRLEEHTQLQARLHTEFHVRVGFCHHMRIGFCRWAIELVRVVRKIPHFGIGII